MSSATPSTKRDLRQEVTDSIIAALEKGVAPWQKPWQPGAFEMPFNPTSGKPYRGGNALHLMVAGMRTGFEDPRWLTYRQATTNGWQVRRGEKGTQIEFWQFPGEAIGEHPGNDRGDSQQERLIYRVYTVFNAKQIEGIPPHSTRVSQEWEIIDTGEKILNHSGARIFHDQSDRAFYDRASDTIHLPPKSAFKSASFYYGTAYHETVHWSGAPGRLNRETLSESYRFGDIAYAKEELRAELASVFLLAERGIPYNPDTHAAYVQSWIDNMKADKHEIFRAARDAHRAADLLLALEHLKSIEEALAYLKGRDSAAVRHEAGPESQTLHSIPEPGKPALEMDL